MLSAGTRSLSVGERGVVRDQQQVRHSAGPHLAEQPRQLAGVGIPREHQMPLRPADGIPVTHAVMPSLTSLQASGCTRKCCQASTSALAV